MTTSRPTEVVQHQDRAQEATNAGDNSGWIRAAQEAWRPDANALVSNLGTKNTLPPMTLMDGDKVCAT